MYLYSEDPEGELSLNLNRCKAQRNNFMISPALLLSLIVLNKILYPFEITLY